MHSRGPTLGILPSTNTLAAFAPTRYSPRAGDTPNEARSPLVAEIGDVTRFKSAAHLTSWAGLTPKHHESDTHVRRGRITKQGSRLVWWAAIESVKRLGPLTGAGPLRERVAAKRGKNIGTVAAARRQLEHVYHALRDGHVRVLTHRGAA
ncbi:transposase [Intrasporangium calvum]|uniref:transposase n=1 Tax=Intrasporangium calvum TaxID=53358 RepID=UPI000A04A49A|nr:transposase [Intrasporangium calvum]